MAFDWVYNATPGQNKADEVIEVDPKGMRTLFEQTDMGLFRLTGREWVDVGRGILRLHDAPSAENKTRRTQFLRMVGPTGREIFVQNCAAVVYVGEPVENAVALSCVSHSEGQVTNLRVRWVAPPLETSSLETDLTDRDAMDEDDSARRRQMEEQDPEFAAWLARWEQPPIDPDEPDDEDVNEDPREIRRAVTEQKARLEFLRHKHAVAKGLIAGLRATGAKEFTGTAVEGKRTLTTADAAYADELCVGLERYVYVSGTGYVSSNDATFFERPREFDPGVNP